jgi:3-hydroxypropanoate dehydrogenase
MHRIVNDEALDILFRTPRGRPTWLARPVSDTMLRALWELVKLAPAGPAADPLRIVFVRSREAKARLGRAIPPEHQDSTLTAPIAAILGHGPGAGAGGGGHRDLVLQAAYVILAARALGLDCEPLWRFDPTLVDDTFFPAGAGASNFLCALGYADHAPPLSPQPRPAFDEACEIL